MDKLIGLLDVDGKMPNLALMKISAHHKKIGNIVEWYKPTKHDSYDSIFASSVFTFSCKGSVTHDMIKGGTGFDVKSRLPADIDDMRPDYSIYPDSPQAIGFLTRGCNRSCHFCFVPDKEGSLRSYRDITDVLQGRSEALLLDNNILASDYGISQIEKIVQLGIKVDFNQGLDARLIDNSVAKLLAQVKWLKPLRMACDNVSQIKSVENATRLLRWHNCTPSRYFVILLIEDIPTAVERLRFLKGMSLDAFAQPFRDKLGTEPPREFRRLARWVNQKALFKKYTWEEYQEKQGDLI